VKDEKGNVVLGRTRWRRFAILMVPATAAGVALMGGMASGAIGASFAISGKQFKVASSQLDGDGFVQYGGVDKDADGKEIPVIVSGIKSATLADICQSVAVVPGQVTVVLKAGGSVGPVTATDLYIDMAQLQGDAEFTNVEIGNDASKLNKGPGKVGDKGMFGQQGDHIKVKNVRQMTYATSAGTFKLKGMDLALQFGPGKECF